jgi:hypothetical protein
MLYQLAGCADEGGASFAIDALRAPAQTTTYIFQDRHSGMNSLRALAGHVRLSCLPPFGLMQICARQICARAEDRETSSDFMDGF